MRSFNRCPNCGEPVSQFAAGCAVCGTDLESHRRELAARRARRPDVALPRPGIPRGDLLPIVVAVLLAAAMPFFGLLLALWLAYDRHRNGRLGARNAFLAIAALALAGLLFPLFLWDRLLYYG